MQSTKSKDQYAVIGNPVAHSLSPRVHALFTEQTGEEMSYIAKRIAAPALAATIDTLEKEGFKGLSVTVPLKIPAFLLMDELSDSAHIAECINTITFKEDGQRFGDNTDGDGLLQDLQKNIGLSLPGKNILIFGAGGAVRNCIWPLLNANIATLTIANRTPEKAFALRDHFDAENIHACGLTDMPKNTFDIIINATSASLQGQLLPITNDLFSEHTVYYDLMYGEKVMPILEHIKTLGMSHVHDGLGMLVEQAALQFQSWRGVMPETGPVIKALRNS